jgi:hypothetical protein
MKTKNVSFLIAMLVMLVSFAAWTGYSQRKTSSIPKKIVWEYKVVNKYISEQDLNEIGAQGWELIQFDPGVRYEGSTAESFFFKRIK